MGGGLGRGVVGAPQAQRVAPTWTLRAGVPMNSVWCSACMRLQHGALARGLPRMQPHHAFLARELPVAVTGDGGQGRG